MAADGQQRSVGGVGARGRCILPHCTIARLAVRLRHHLAPMASLVLLAATAGCSLFHPASAPAPIENPMFVPAMDREFLWNQAVDAVDDYFRIEREERMRLIGGVLTEGRIDTFPTTGSTLLEPWRGDSTPGYEKWHSTLQSIRRRGIIRVIPTTGGYLVDAQIYKELEDLDKPENATAGGATLRHDGSLVRQEGAAGRYSHTLGWIPLGRDSSMEQTVLAHLAARLGLPSSGWSMPAKEMVEELNLPPPRSLHPMRSLDPAEELPPFDRSQPSAAGPQEELPPPNVELSIPQP